MDNTSCEKGEGLEEPFLQMSIYKLERQWTWYVRDATGKISNWDKNLTEIESFDTATGFWILQRHIKDPSQIKESKNLSIFRKGVYPRWEDPANKGGGQFAMSINRDELASSEKLDKLWLNLILLMIGENFGGLNDKINGIDLAARRSKFRVALWVGEFDEKMKSFNINSVIEKIKSICDAKVEFERFTW